MRIVAVIQVRMGSNRLKGKSLMVLHGRPMLDHVIERVLAVPGVDEVVLATSTAERDQALLPVAAARGVRSWCGSETDVMERMYEAAASAGAETVMRVTADCPLFAPDVASRVLGAFSEAQCPAFPFAALPADYVSNDTTCSGYPDGLDVEVFKMAALEAAMDATRRRERDKRADENRRLVDREHVTAWMRRNLSCRTVACEQGDYTRLKLSVDLPDDFERVRAVYRHVPLGDLSWRATAEACLRAGLWEPAA